MSKLYNSIRITGVAHTLSAILGIPAPEKAEAPIDVITRAASRAFDGQSAQRMLIYNPDAIALWLFQKYTALFADAILQSDIQLPMHSVMPSVTPVCFASMYTGAMPSVHGIQEYVKPVLTTDTFFDACLRVGKKPAIVSTTGDSISKIFLGREMDYFIYDSYEDCNRKGLELMEQDAHDVIVLYNHNYDKVMHRMGPEAPEAMDMLRHNVASYAMLVDAAQRYWAPYRAMVSFCPDHGCHEIDGDLGSHGLDMPEDMNVIHLHKFLKPKA